MPAIDQRLLEYYGDGTGDERCGLILLRDDIIEVENIAVDPAKSYEMSPEVVLANLPKLIGTWHTHPGAPNNLSDEDFTGFRNWPGLVHYIIGNDGVREYRVTKSGMIVQA